MSSVTYVEANGASHTVDVAVGENVMRGALYNGIEGIAGECGGAASCATCHCYVDPDWTEAVGGPADAVEEELLEATACPPTSASRLSCQIIMSDALDGLVVHLPEREF